MFKFVGESFKFCKLESRSNLRATRWVLNVNVSIFNFSVIIHHNLKCGRLPLFLSISTKGFLIFSGGMKREYWPEMGYLCHQHDVVPSF